LNETLTETDTSDLYGHKVLKYLLDEDSTRWCIITKNGIVVSMCVKHSIATRSIFNVKLCDPLSVINTFERNLLSTTNIFMKYGCCIVLCHWCLHWFCNSNFMWDI
jgi:hypothetical protein